MDTTLFLSVYVIMCLTMAIEPHQMIFNANTIYEKCMKTALQHKQDCWSQANQYLGFTDKDFMDDISRFRQAIAAKLNCDYEFDERLQKCKKLIELDHRPKKFKLE